MAATKVVSELNGTVWKIETETGARVAEGDTLILLESMKMEIPVMAPRDGVVTEILVREEQQVTEGQHVATLE